MEPNSISLKQKLGNAFANMKIIMQSDKRVLFGVVGVSILVLLFMAMFIFSSLRGSKTNVVTEQTPNSPLSSLLGGNKTNIVKRTIPATLSLVLTDPKKEYHVGDTITFSLVGDTGGQIMRGYDAAFKFDSNIVSFVSEKNLFPQLSYYRRIRGNWVILSGIQPFKATNAIKLSKTKVMGVTFKAVKAGTAYFPISYIPDTYNDSNLIDTSSNDMLTSATGIVVQIQP